MDTKLVGEYVKTRSFLFLTTPYNYKYNRRIMLLEAEGIYEKRVRGERRFGS